MKKERKNCRGGGGGGGFVFGEAATGGDGGTSGARKIIAVGAGDAFDDAELAQAGELSGQAGGRELADQRNEIGAADAGDAETGTVQGGEQDLFGVAEEVEAPGLRRGKLLR